MKKIALAVFGACLAAGAQAGAPDWSKVAERKIKVFYPGQSALEWVMNQSDHSAVPDIVNKKRPCAKCHEGDANEIGDKIVAGKPVGQSKSVLEPKPINGKAGWIPVTFKAAHDGEKVYFRFEWTPPQIAGPQMDKKTNYVKDADLATGKFYDLIQFKSAKGEKPVDGYVADQRYMEGGKGLVKAEGVKDGNKWVVTFERTLAGGGKGDHAITPDKIFNFGFAIHESFAEARYHYVSLGYQFGLDKAVEGVKNYYNIVKQ